MTNNNCGQFLSRFLFQCFLAWWFTGRPADRCHLGHLLTPTNKQYSSSFYDLIQFTPDTSLSFFLHFSRSFFFSFPWSFFLLKIFVKIRPKLNRAMTFIQKQCVFSPVDYRFIRFNRIDRIDYFVLFKFEIPILKFLKFFRFTCCTHTEQHPIVPKKKKFFHSFDLYGLSVFWFFFLTTNRVNTHAHFVPFG